MRSLTIPLKRTRALQAVASLWLLGAALVLPSAGRQEHPLNSAAAVRALLQAKPAPISLGTVSGNLYTNESLGLEFTFPADWFVDKHSMEAENEAANKFHSSQQQNTPSSNEHTSYTLLIVSESQEQPGCRGCESVEVFGPKIELSAGPFTAFQGHQTALDIQIAMKHLLEKRKIYEIIGGPEACSYGGQDFSRMETKASVFPDRFTYLGDAITIRNSYWIEFQLHARSPEELDKLYQTLGSVQFTSTESDR